MQMRTAQRTGPRHGVRIFILWLVVSAILMPIVYFVWGPHLPPGTMSDQANGQRFDNQVLATVATPVVAIVLLYFGYALMFFRHRGEETDEDIYDSPPIKGSALISGAWIGSTALIVLSLAGFGTYELVSPYGAGSGSGPAPIWNPSSHTRILPVQVIAQQWRFTFRYPTYGGMETTVLAVPAGTEIQFNVTSIDVIHDFWAYQLGVKADANPGVNNVAYVTPLTPGGFDVHCAELCGVWHGAMFAKGEVMTAADFQTWATNTEQNHSAVTKLLPKYALTYAPDTGGAGGTYYGTQYPVSP